MPNCKQCGGKYSSWSWTIRDDGLCKSCGDKADEIAKNKTEITEKSTKSVNVNTTDNSNKSDSHTEGLPWGLIVVAAAGVFLYTHKNNLAQKGGFLYIIGAVFAAIFAANLLTRK